MVTRELRSDTAGRELVERLIAAAGGVAGLVPSGTESIPVKRSWNSEHGLQAERSICRETAAFDAVGGPEIRQSLFTYCTEISLRMAASIRLNAWKAKFFPQTSGFHAFKAPNSLMSLKKIVEFSRFPRRRTIRKAMRHI